ncbi:MAG TPA: dual specificity protein phosphatase family protein [Desulfobacterales bacterium]
MWTWSLNWGEVTPSIVIGSCPMTAADLKRIVEENRIGAVLSLQHDDCLAYWNIDYASVVATARSMNVTMARCPIRDFDIADMRRRLPAAVSMLAGLIGSDRRTYVHCTAGMGRAPLTVLGYLVWVAGYNSEDAIRLILQGRPEAVPAWEALHGAETDLEKCYRREIKALAYKLHEAGINADPGADWHQAKAGILREKLAAGDLRCSGSDPENDYGR